MKRETLRWAVWWSLPFMWLLQFKYPDTGPIAGWVLGVIAGSVGAYGGLWTRSNDRGNATADSEAGRRSR